MFIVLALLGCGGGGDPVGALQDFGPTPVPLDRIRDDGLILTRLVIAVDPNGRPGDLDRAIEAVDGTLAASRPGIPWITIDVPPMADEAAALAVAAELEQQRGIAEVQLAWAPILQAAPSQAAADGNPELASQGFFGAWNAAPLARATVPVYVADHYASTTPHPAIPSQRFEGLQTSGGDRGNHGFLVAGIIGAAADDSPPTGTHPDPAQTLDLVSVQVLGSGSFFDTMLLLDSVLPANGFFVLNTSLGFAEATPRTQRADLALLWRGVVLRHGGDFLHTAAMGNEALVTGAADLASPFVLQARLDDLKTLVPDDEGFAERFDLEVRLAGGTARAVGTTLAVGASDQDGFEAEYSNRGGDVRAIGSQIRGVCVVADPDCDGAIQISQGTSMSSPVIAGLAAWLRAIDPTLSAPEIAAILRASFDGRWVDARRATMALESRGKPVLKTLLDLDEDGTFDEADVNAVVDAILAAEQAIPDPAFSPRTWTRADLNGDGRVRSDTRVAFDLDGDGVIGSVTLEIPSTSEAGETTEITLDEAQVSDADILCAGAYSPRYTGDEDERNAALFFRCTDTSDSLELVGIHSRSFASTEISQQYTGDPGDSYVFFFGETEEGGLDVGPLGNNVVTPSPSFTLANTDFAFANRMVFCQDAGSCPEPGFLAFDGHPFSQVMWDCEASETQASADCTLLLNTRVNAALPQDAPAVIARGDASARMTIAVHVKRPLDYRIDSTLFAHPTSDFAAVSTVHLQGLGAVEGPRQAQTVLFRGAGSEQPDVGALQGRLEPGLYEFTAEAVSAANVRDGGIETIFVYADVSVTLHLAPGSVLP